MGVIRPLPVRREASHHCVVHKVESVTNRVPKIAVQERRRVIWNSIGNILSPSHVFDVLLDVLCVSWEEKNTGPAEQPADLQVLLWVSTR